MDTKVKHEKRLRRHKRIRAKIYGTAVRPRLCVFRSEKHIYAQLINDQTAKTIVAGSDLEFKKKRGTKIEKAKEIGRLIAKKAKDLKIERVVFDRGGYKYHGRVKAVAEGAKEEGLIF